MRLSITACCLLIASVFINFSCTEQDVPLKKTVMTQEEVLKVIENGYLGVSKVERKSGSGTVDLTNTEPYKSGIKNTFLTFRGGSIQFVSGSAVENDQFVPTAQTFSFQTRIVLPMYMSYAWNNSSGTVVAHSTNQTTSTFGIPADQDASIDVSSIVSYSGYEEAKSAAIPPSFTFNYSTNDPKLGPVTYVYTLKPLWSYYRVPLSDTYFFVMF